MPPRVTLFDIFFSQGNLHSKCVKLIDYFLGSMISLFVPPIKASSWEGKVKRILVIRPGGMGDAIFLLPILRVLKSQCIAIDVLCEDRNVQVFSSQGYPVFLYHNQVDFWSVMKQEYDVVIDTEQWHYLSALVCYWSKAAYKIGFGTRPLRLKLFHKSVSYDENGYALDNFVRLLEDFVPPSIRPVDINDCFEVSSAVQQWAVQQLQQKSVTIFLGGSIQLRRFSEQQLRFFIKKVLGAGYNAVLLGGKDVQEIPQELVDLMKDFRVLNFVGKISLMESAALIQRSEKFIGPDSGLMHLACAVGTPVIAAFGPGNLFKWQPKGEKHKVITEQVSCSPCTRFGYTVPTCNESYICVKNLQLQDLCNDL